MSKEEKGRKLFHWIEEREREEALLLLRDPSTSINWKTPLFPKDSSLHLLCGRRYHFILLKHLLARADADINLKDQRGRTPLSVACIYGKTEAVKSLLEDERVQADEPDKDNCSPLWHACSLGRSDIVALLLASGEQMDQTRRNSGPVSEEPYLVPSRVTPLYAAGERGHSQIKTTVEKYRQDPIQTMAELRMELSIPGTFVLLMEQTFYIYINHN